MRELCQGDRVVRLTWIVQCGAVGLPMPARLTLVDDHPALAGSEPQADRSHLTFTGRRSVSRPVIDVHRPQAPRAMVPVTAVGEWAYVFGASLADERHVLLVSADGLLLQVEGASTCRCRVPFALAPT